MGGHPAGDSAAAGDTGDGQISGKERMTAFVMRSSYVHGCTRPVHTGPEAKITQAFLFFHI